VLEKYGLKRGTYGYTRVEVRPDVTKFKIDRIYKGHDSSSSSCAIDGNLFDIIKIEKILPLGSVGQK